LSRPQLPFEHDVLVDVGHADALLRRDARPKPKRQKEMPGRLIKEAQIMLVIQVAHGVAVPREYHASE